jgi:hypothetical protein
MRTTVMHELKICPSCNGTFECKSGSITICHCSHFLLTGEVKDLLAKKFDDCLCGPCLERIMRQNVKPNKQ